MLLEAARTTLKNPTGLAGWRLLQRPRHIGVQHLNGKTTEAWMVTHRATIYLDLCGLGVMYGVPLLPNSTEGVPYTYIRYLW